MPVKNATFRLLPEFRPYICYISASVNSEDSQFSQGQLEPGRFTVSLTVPIFPILSLQSNKDTLAEI